MIEKIKIDDLIQNATALHQQLKFSEAQDIYEHILTIEPDNFDALRLLGLLFAQTKKNKEAVEILSKALKVNPDHARSLSNLGIALKGLERLDEALASFNQALSLEPSFTDAYINRGSLLQNMGRFDEALVSIDKALSHGPAYPETYFDRGNILQNLKRFDEALASFDRAISLKPDYAEAYYYIGNILLELNRFDDALASYDKAIKFKSDYADAFNNRGVVLNKLKRFDDALASYDKSIDLNPNNANTFNNRANTFKELKFLDKALNNYAKAISINPDYAEAYHNRGTILQEYKRLDEAINSYNKAIEINSDYADAGYNSSICNLIIGNFKQGWKEYEWRWLLNSCFESKSLESIKPSWDFKKTDLRLFVWAEQGIGDHIFFGKLLSELLEDVPNLLVQIDQRLIPIFNRSLPKIKFYPSKNLDPKTTSIVPESDYDIQVAIGSLGNYLRRDEKDFDYSQYKFLKDNESKTLEIKKDLMASTKSKNKICGISWRSKNPAAGAKRTIPLKYFIEALDLEGYIFVSLQYGKTKDEIKEVKDEFGIDIISYEKVDNFIDIDGLASLIQACDEVISIDNSTCHLAAALGKKVRILLTHSPYWTWMLGDNSSESLWYPSAKLYKQDNENDWKGVFKKLNNELKIPNNK